MWECLCDCGNKKAVMASHLRDRGTISCGCYQKEMLVIEGKKKNFGEITRTHGLSKTKLYNVWNGMRNRCNNPKAEFYSIYGGRGIKVCDDWQKFMPFYEWATANGYAEGLSIDRIDGDGNYCPENCRWITIQEQQRNRSNNRHYEYKGKSYTVREIAAIVGMKPRTIQGRIERGWSIERVFETKLLAGNGKGQR